MLKAVGFAGVSAIFLRRSRKGKGKRKGKRRQGKEESRTDEGKRRNISVESC